MSRIIFIPTSHIARESLTQIEQTIRKEKPQCIAVELDLNRYLALKSKESSTIELIKALGFSTFLIYFILKKLQTWLGKKVDIMPGSEMLKAIEIAKNSGLKIAFIDRDIRITLLRLKEKVSLSEKLKLLWFLVKAPLSVQFIKKRARKKEYVDLSKVPSKELVDEAINLLKKEFPQLYKVLVQERDEYMAKKLTQLSKEFEKIVAITGAGHEKGLKRILSF